MPTIRAALFASLCLLLTTTRMDAADSDLGRLVDGLIAGKGDLNQRYDARFKVDGGQIPLLFWAVSRWDASSAEKLLKNGADPNIESLPGSRVTALFEAPTSTEMEPDPKLAQERRATSLRICEMLIKHKADVNYAGKLGDTPLHKAALNGREDICELLIMNGAKVNVADRIGTTPLHKAAQYGFWKVVEVLLKNKANANAEDLRKNRPLKAAEARAEEGTNKEMRQKFGNGYFAGSDYDKTIAALKKASK